MGEHHRDFKKNMGKIIFITFLVCCIIAGFGSCLDFEREAEGPCHRQMRVTPYLNTTWAQNTDFPYLAAGSKYHLYRLTRTRPQQVIPEYKFYYEACLKSTIDEQAGTGSVLSFGRTRNGFRVAEVAPGIMDFTEVTRETRDTCRHTVTLTDNKSFVFFSNCWLKAGQRSWDLISTKEVLGEKEVALIEEHATSLGFDRKQFVFLKCVK